jgi:transcription-repair coupling factor (superfamily II helicase)
MAIAMKDLEIRGAGNLLGGEQSGHIADVGFDLYVRLVGEAVNEFRESQEPGSGVEQLKEVRIELPVDAHLPHDYVPSERLRLEMYKRLAEVRAADDVAALREELVDRYGNPPAPVDRLLEVALLRVRLRTFGVGEVTMPGNFVRFAPVKLPESRLVRLKRLYPKAIHRAQTDTLLVPKPVKRDADLVAFATEVVHQILDPATT